MLIGNAMKELKISLKLNKNFVCSLFYASACWNTKFIGYSVSIHIAQQEGKNTNNNYLSMGTD